MCMDWLIIAGLVMFLGTVLLVVYLKAGSGVKLIEKPSFRNLPGCGRQLMRKIKEKLGGC